MKAPSKSNVQQLRPNPLQVPGQPQAIPPEYLAMAAAHMMKLGKQVTSNQDQFLGTPQGQ